MTLFLTVAFLVLFTTASGLPGRTKPCLDGCLCEEDETNPLIRCESGDRKDLFIPTRPMSGYQIIALSCNDIVTLPDKRTLMLAFPDLKSIDVEGNTRFDCSQISKLSDQYAIASDCDKKQDKKLNCAIFTKECDWKCSSLKKLQELWNEFKSALAGKAQEIGADKAMEKMQDWFSSTFDKISRAMD